MGRIYTYISKIKKAINILARFWAMSCTITVWFTLIYAGFQPDFNIFIKTNIYNEYFSELIISSLLSIPAIYIIFNDNKREAFGNEYKRIKHLL